MQDVEIATTYHAMGGIYHLQGKCDKALECYHKALDIRINICGKDHPDVAISYVYVAINYKFQNKYDIALECYNKSFNIYKKKLGTTHPETIDTLKELLTLRREIAARENQL